MIVNNELERTEKIAFVACVRYAFDNFLDRLRKFTKGSVSGSRFEPGTPQI
jgi:hypothetical protein